MKDRRGALGRATGLAEGVAATESRGYDRVIETCTRMVELVNRDGE
jgi:hypothetical protein